MICEAKQTFTQAERSDLRALAALMIPASEVFGVPGADDEAIFGDITSSIGPDFLAVREALRVLAELSCGRFTELDEARRKAVAKAYLADERAGVSSLCRVVLQCYYRDDRVLRALGLEPRAPFPLGHELEQGDWSLLDAVRSRPASWRDVP